ncbi:MAG TPA: hypothetical protein VJO33_13165 [Gemmatimonadaceae bacterium]|nr:hypothetical protein [Gemmatimonadaceae bacterium]
MSISQHDPDERPVTALEQRIGLERPILGAALPLTVCETVDLVTMTRTLVFLGNGVARRVRIYPTNWRELSDDALYTLSWSR